MGLFFDFHILPGTHTASHTSSVTNAPFGAFYQFVLNVISAVKG
ncbi:hypothetical protein [Lactiplantibacillus plajomi]|uniref:Uncharacterized protein n=1 Tax=Lactiplantibacillus plajomi TaxID=1457217 RepID=A0ABV6K0P5_9LACO|nr:hypothetical protein [Lactiplantibacillus plajomi]